MKEKVSIIIPIFNTEKYIGKCIESVIKQSYKNLEIILIDDESTDNSYKICQKYKEKDNRIILKRKKNEGPSGARNLGLEVSTGEFIVFLDSDDYLEKNVIKNMIEAFKEDSYITVYFTKVVKEIEYKRKNEFKEYIKDDYLKKIILGKEAGCVCGGLFEKEKIGDLRFDTKTYFLEDAIFLIEYLKKIKYVKFVKGCYYYTENYESITIIQNKVLENIYSINYSLNKINEITKNEFQEEIDNRKLVLFEKELAKVLTLQYLREILYNEKVNKIFEKVKVNSKTSIIYKILLNLSKNRKIYIIYLYINIRKIIKKVKNKYLHYREIKK